MDKLTFVTIHDAYTVALVPIRRVIKVLRSNDGKDEITLDDMNSYNCIDADTYAQCRFEDSIVDFKENDDE